MAYNGLAGLPCSVRTGPAAPVKVPRVAYGHFSGPKMTLVQLGDHFIVVTRYGSRLTCQHTLGN